MKKLALISASLLALSAQATAQLRPGDCRPVFPVMDQVAPVAPQADVITEQAPPQVIEKRRFLGGGLLLIPAAFLVGVLVTHHHHCCQDTVSPA